MDRDDRFKGIATDPRFRSLPARLRKVKIDQRFKGMFKDKKFKVKCTVDERGRPVKLSSNKHLKKFYELSSSEAEDSDDDEEDKEADSEIEETTQSLSAAVTGEEQNEDEEDDESDEEDDEAAGSDDESEEQEGGDSDDESAAETEDKKANKDRKRKKKLKSEKKNSDESESDSEEEDEGITPMEDYARGVVMYSSSSDDSDSEQEEELPYDQEAHGDHYWGEHDADAEPTEEISNRLAIQNMDWDRIKANDLFMLLNSFKPAQGTVKYVKIYRSEYGKEKMKEDDLTGPKELKKVRLNKDGDAEGKLKDLHVKDQKQAMIENLRQYQLNRLKYYYAVAEFESKATANHIYTECDGREYLASCTQLDLRFIPDEMEFDDEEMKESATHVSDNYEPKFFINPALGQSLVKCTWDENNPDRYSMLNKKYKSTDLEHLDMQNYLASDSNDEEEEEEEGDKDSTEAKSSPKKKTRGRPIKDKPANEPALAGDSSDDEDEDSIAKYRQLLLGGGGDKSNGKNTKGDEQEEGESDADDIDMEITWDTGLKDTAEDLLKKKSKSKDKTGQSVFDREREKKREKRKKEKLLAADKETKPEQDTTKSKKKTSQKEETFQAFSDDDVDDIPEGFTADDLLSGSESETEDKPSSNKNNKSDSDSKSKKKDKRKKNKKEDGDDMNGDDIEDNGEDHSADLALMVMEGEEESNRKHFNIKEIAEYENMTKSKRRRKMKANSLKTIEDDFTIDVKDDRFSAMYSSHLYNIDPSSQDYRKTKAMDAIIDEKQRRIQNSERDIDKPYQRKRKSDKISTSLDNGKHSNNDSTGGKAAKSSANLSNLVKSVKAKTKVHANKQKNVTGMTSKRKR